jgi:hypothetical protein
MRSVLFVICIKVNRKRFFQLLKWENKKDCKNPFFVYNKTERSVSLMKHSSN